MDYKLFDDYITLQALLKETGIIQSGGAIKSYLADNTVLFNGQDEKRRGKKLRLGDKVELLSQGITITLIQPNEEEFKQHQLDLEEKNRVAELVKKMNKNNKKQVKKANTTSKTAKQTKKPVRFPGM
ncbi:S4 domain-containing protein YaaA [Streptococcus pluranimalium]|uniref:S4 domain-containing protein YaaA n=1 Tax=Streptococcus pluranimalium TaxID=82348 RepID=UPI002414F1A6|nr:S4 domain-containing protein YaaA [Streptococcus pluranimalium]MDY3041068.1 S4 domain-containing protein YaaA [Streptococcus pluranimalium]WFM79876.1 S4 domain-containing protein YaaA [Streptococcus pluranimalium]